ncbi:MAG: ribosome-binding factor A [Firmicutes bacterium]|nr:ribosome-binding factor A [Bacillota bacterium]
MAKGHRQGRMGEEIRKIISDLLFKGLKDPRLSAMISITAVEVTSDGSYATVYLSVLGMN